MDSERTRAIHNHLLNLSPSEFERFVSEVWKQMGWDTQVTPNSNDNGIDIIATKSGVHEQKAVIQAKKYSPSNKIGQPDIQQYDTLRRQDSSVDFVVVVTTSEFTSNAKNLSDNLNVKIVNGREFSHAALEHMTEERISKLLSESNAATTSIEVNTDEKDGSTDNPHLSSTLSTILERKELTPFEAELTDIYKEHWERRTESNHNHTPGSSMVFKFSSEPEYLIKYQVLTGLHSIEFTGKKRWGRAVKTAKKYNWEIDSTEPSFSVVIDSKKPSFSLVGNRYNKDGASKYLLNLKPDGNIRENFNPEFNARFSSIVIEQFLDSNINDISEIYESAFANDINSQTHSLDSI